MFSSQSDEPPLPPQIDDTTTWPAPRPRAGWQGLLLLGALSFGLATLALLLLRQPESIASVWWANAVAAGFLVRHARAAWPGPRGSEQCARRPLRRARRRLEPHRLVALGRDQLVHHRGHQPGEERGGDQAADDHPGHR